MLTSTMTMPTTTDGSASLTSRRVGLVLLGIAVLFLTFDTVIKLMANPMAVAGAVATHVRIGNPVFSHLLFPVYVAIFIWGGLYLRDVRVRTLVQSILTK